MTVTKGISPTKPEDPASSGNVPEKVVPGKPGKSRAKLAKPINSRDLISRIIASRRPILTPGVLVGLKDSPPISSHEIVDIRAAAVADSTLSIVGAVMLTAVASRAFPQLLRQLTDFTRSVCENAETARALSVGVSVFPPAEQADITELRNALKRFRELRDAGIKTLKEAPDGRTKDGKRKVKALNIAAENLSLTTIAWSYAVGALDEAALLEIVTDAFKGRGKSRSENRSATLFGLLGKRIEKKGVAALLGCFEERQSSLRTLLLGAQSRVEQLERDAASRANVIGELHGHIEGLEKRLADANANIVSLEERARELEEAAGTKAVHHTDDLVKLRTRVVRLLEDERAHLGDSLEALRSKPPKATVAATFIETIHDKIDAEIARLKETK